MKEIKNALMHFNMTEDVISLGLENLVSYKETNAGEEPSGVYLKLKYKTMWCKKMYPFSYTDYVIVSQTQNSTLVTVTLYEGTVENRILGKGTASISSMDLPICCEPDIMAHKRLVYAIGSASSRAYTNAGFGLQFDEDIYDTFEDMKKENKEVGNSIEATEIITTTSLDPEEAFNEETVPDFIKETENIPVEKTAIKESSTKQEDDKELPMTFDKMTLEEARAVVITVGKMGEAKVTMEYIEKKCAANLVYIYTHGCTEKEKEAIEVIANASDSIKAIFAEKNILLGTLKCP